MSIAIVTAFTTGYDALQRPVAGTDIDYVAFVERTSAQALPQPWSAQALPNISRTPKRRCLYVKTHLVDLVGPHDVLIWIDARLRLTKSAGEIVDRYLPKGTDLVTFAHPRNPDLRSEIDEIRRERLIPENELDEFARSVGESTLDHQPHSETNCIIMRANSATRQFGLDWWTAIEAAPARDQLTFDHVLRDSALTWAQFDDGTTSADNCDFLEKGLHLRRRTGGATPEHRISVRPTIPISDRSPDMSPAVNTPVSIVVPVSGGRLHTGPCLESVLRSDLQGELIIVDNGSDPDTAAHCREIAERHHERLTIRLEQTDEPLGYGRAANLGVSMATNDIALILNSDTLVPPILSSVATRAFDDPLTFATGFVSNHAGDLSVATTTYERLLDRGLDATDLTTICADFARGWSETVPPQIVRSVHGSAIAIRRRAFGELGGFDVTAFPEGYGEEVDLCLRATRLGLTNRVDTSVFYHHTGNATYAERRPALNRLGKARLRERHPARVLDAISLDLKLTPSVRALGIDLTNHLKRIEHERNDLT